MQSSENQKTTIETLSEFATLTKRKVFFSETPYPNTALYNVVEHKKTLYIPNSSDEQCFLIGYHDPKSTNENELFFGAFFPLSIPRNKVLKIRKKDILDKLNPFLKKKIYKTNSNQFDSLTVAAVNDTSLANSVLNNIDTQKLILESLEIMDFINVGINEFELDFVPNFKGQSNFGVFTKQKWIVDSDTLEKLFTKIEQLRKQIAARINES